MEKVFGGLLMGCGILVAGLSGLCTLLAAGSALVGSTSSQEMMSIVPAALIFGGIPLLIGLGIAYGGRALIRSAREDETRSPYPSAPDTPPQEVTPARPPVLPNVDAPAEDKD
jgi:hypothetical protein